MNQFFKEYRWKEGKPKGKFSLDDPENVEISYKIVTDPYHKRYTIEKYLKGVFSTLVYDSLLLDFRKLHPQEQLAWQRQILEETPDQMTTLIRNMEDRVILIEKYLFKDSLCQECSLYSPHGLLLSTHKMYYKLLKHPFNGVILLDSQGIPCLRKVYTANEKGEFCDLIEEKWDMENETWESLKRE